MKKIILTMTVAAVTLTAVDAVAQNKAAATETKTEQSAENIKKEADALKNRITQYTEKVEANRENGKVDYEAEQVRIAEMKAKWETLSGETWKEEKKKK
jgi:gas vesicle protein